MNTATRTPGRYRSAGIGSDTPVPLAADRTRELILQNVLDG
ncbi:hypothetical protein [Nocardia sp. NPDC005998]